MVLKKHLVLRSPFRASLSAYKGGWGKGVEGVIKLGGERARVIKNGYEKSLSWIHTHPRRPEGGRGGGGGGSSKQGKGMADELIPFLLFGGSLAKSGWGDETKRGLLRSRSSASKKVRLKHLKEKKVHYRMKFLGRLIFPSSKQRQKFFCPHGNPPPVVCLPPVSPSVRCQK